MAHGHVQFRHIVGTESWTHNGMLGRVGQGSKEGFPGEKDQRIKEYKIVDSLSTRILTVMEAVADQQQQARSISLF